MPRIDVITDRHSIIEAIKEFQAGVKEIWCACVEAGLPSFSVGAVKEGYLAAKARGVNIRYVTEITPANLQHCQEIMGFAELRHLGMVKGNFALSESEYVAGVLEGNTLVSLVRCDVPELVRQQHLVFQTLWDHSEPAAGRITALMSWR